MEKSSSTDSQPDPSSLGTAQSRRKSSVNAIAAAKARNQPIQGIEDVALLSEADRRLAELGYAQVRLELSYLTVSLLLPADMVNGSRYTSVNSHGYHASLLPLQSRACSPVLRPPMSTLLKPVVLRRLCGVG